MVQHFFHEYREYGDQQVFCFQPSKGVSQGCPLSPYLFILSTKILSNKIRQDSDVNGIKVFENEIKLSQFADDTTLFNADLASLKRHWKW